MLLTALVFLIVLSILVLVHELGHFLVARKIGVHVEEFGMGLPPRIFGKKIGNTIYSLNALPIGGFVKLAGEDEDEGKTKLKLPKEKYFWARSKKERSLILIAGVTMNFLLAVLITAILLVGGVHEPSGRVHIEEVVPQSPAEVAGLEINDIVEKIIVKGVAYQIKDTGKLVEIIKNNLGTSLVFVINRDSEILSKEIFTRIHYPSDQGPTGIVISDLEIRKYTIAKAPFAALRITVMRMQLMVTGIARQIYNLVTLKSKQTDIAGPIGIAQVTGRAVKFGFKAVLEFMSILSLNLAILNILPFPALDGGRLVFIFAEKILGRKVRPVFEKNTHQIGMLILLFLILLVSINDIMRIARGG